MSSHQQLLKTGVVTPKMNQTQGPEMERLRVEKHIYTLHHKLLKKHCLCIYAETRCGAGTANVFMTPSSTLCSLVRINQMQKNASSWQVKHH